MPHDPATLLICFLGGIERVGRSLAMAEVTVADHKPRLHPTHRIKQRGRIPSAREVRNFPAKIEIVVAPDPFRSALVEQRRNFRGPCSRTECVAHIAK